MNSSESSPDSTDKSTPPCDSETRDDSGGADTATHPIAIKPDCSDWPELEPPEIKELVLSIIATSIRLNPFRPPENDEQRRS